MISNGGIWGRGIDPSFANFKYLVMKVRVFENMLWLAFSLNLTFSFPENGPALQKRKAGLQLPKSEISANQTEL